MREERNPKRLNHLIDEKGSSKYQRDRKGRADITKVEGALR